MATGTGNLPNQNMVFTPFDILTAEEQNQLVENIESLADGSGQGDDSIPNSALIGGITGDKLGTSAILLDHQTKTSNQAISTGGGNQSIGLSSTVTVPAGGRSVRVELFIGSITSGGGAAIATTRLWSGSIGGTQLASLAWKFQDAGDNKGQYMYAIETAPSAGSHTYVASMSSSAANVQINAGATTPSTLTVTLL